MRRTASRINKCIIIVCAFLGVIIGFFQAKLDGYFAWYKKLYFFTVQSNLWIAVTLLIIALLPIIYSGRGKWKDRFYLLRFIFTVCITITGLIFCCFLAPFADESYRPWAFASILVHIVVPLLSIIDYFVDDYHVDLKLRHYFYPLIPPIVYFVITMIMGACGVTFRGVETFPYFFMNFNSPVGLFGAVLEPIPSFGSIYWIIFIFLLIIGLSFLYGKLHPTAIEMRREKKNSVL